MFIQIEHTAQIAIYQLSQSKINLQCLILTHLYCEHMYNMHRLPGEIPIQNKP